MSHFQNLSQLLLGDDNTKYVEGFGGVIIQLFDGQTTKTSNVYYVSGLTKNLFYVSELTANGADIKFYHNHCIIKARFRCQQLGRLYSKDLFWTDFSNEALKLEVGNWGLSGDKGSPWGWWGSQQEHGLEGFFMND